MAESEQPTAPPAATPAATRTTTIDERRAAALLGLALPELRWFSRLLGLGHSQENAENPEIVFTFDELKRLSSAAAASAK